jgi:hypothetical protein
MRNPASNGNSGISASDLKQPTDTEPRTAISMDSRSIPATDYPDDWRAMDDHGFRFVVYSGQWYAQNWPEEVLRRLEDES